MEIPTAREFLMGNGSYSHLAIEFAKLHVKAALEEAAKKAEIINDPNDYSGNTGSEWSLNLIVSKESIINSYPLTNIK